MLPARRCASAAEKPRSCHPEEPKATKDLRISVTSQIPGCFAEFTLSEDTAILRFAQDGSEGLTMTRSKSFSATC